MQAMFGGSPAAPLAAAPRIRSTAGTAEDRLAAVEELLEAVSQERDVLADELQVRTQMSISLANAYHGAKSKLDSTSAAATSKDVQLAAHEREVETLAAQLAEQRSRAAAADRRIRELEAELHCTTHQATDAERRAEAAAVLEADVARLQREKEEMHATMEDWKAKVKEALKENRKKETQHQLTEIELQQKLARMQEQLDKAAFDAETAKAREAVVNPKATVETQTDPLPSPPKSPAVAVVGDGRRVAVADALHADTPPAMPIMELGTPRQSARDPRAQGSSSPPSIRPEKPAAPDAAPPPPLIVSVKYGSSDDGWTVSTKLLVKAGMTVQQTVADVCERINQRYGRDVDCADMCLKTLHAKAQRFIVLSDHREMHSFAYFTKLQAEGKGIDLQLEPIPRPGSGAAGSPASARLSAGRASFPIGGRSSARM